MCPPELVWRGSTLTCVLLKEVHCTQNLQKQGGLSNGEQMSCLCTSDYYWSNYFRRCQYNCSNVAYADLGSRPD